MKLAILISYLVLAAASVSSVSTTTTNPSRNLQDTFPGEYMNVDLETADVDISTKTFTYKWALGSEIELGTNFEVQLFDSDCWSKNGSPMAIPDGFAVSTRGAITVLTYTDEALFRERQADGTIGFCMVARSYLEGPLYIDLMEVKTVIQLTNIDQIVGSQEVRPFSVEESTTQTSFQVEIPLLPKNDNQESPNQQNSSWPGQELVSEDQSPVSAPLGLIMIIFSSIFMVGALVLAYSYNRTATPQGESTDVPLGASDENLKGDDTTEAADDEDMAQV
jgi:hypothetical protein